ncbi:MAG: hypothetical protein V4447_03800 [Pseudomonadota bacterium]
MLKNLFAIILAGMISASLTGCAVYATPRHAGIYVEPLPVVVGSGWGGHHHSRRW